LEIIAEIEPTRSYEKLIGFVDAVRDYADWVDVPEAPLGKSRALSLVVATVLQKDFGIPAIAHVRVQDHNLTGLHNVLGASRIAGIKRVVLLRGDPIEGAKACNELSPEEALEILREENPGAEGGLLLSLRKPEEMIIKRLRSSADFYLVLNASRPEDVLRYKELSVKGKFIPYILVVTERNRELLESSLPRAPKFELKALQDVLKRFGRAVDGVLISVPGDLRGLREALRAAREL